MSQDNDSNAANDAVHTVIVEVHQNLLKFLICRLGNEDEAADVLHDFYVKVLTRVDDIRDTQMLRAWMHRVLETTLVDYYRTQSSRRHIERDYSYQESLVSTDEDDLDFIICVCLYKLLPTLKAEYANVLWRADLVGESREGLAAALDITVSHLRVRLHRARQALRQRLEETCRTCPMHGYLDCQCDYSKHARAGIQQVPDALP
ncbi:RNA polymerase sigma factor [Halomonas sp. GXIMD04776]|uniref:RNA polymerase sigma factor n=1 Tax=Halomonas sp. GXIMD04776 TaxID=3415605 RepID=UPI003CBF3AFD